MEAKMNETSKQPSKFARFVRNHAALLLLIFCVVAITAVVLAVSFAEKQPDLPVVKNPDDDAPVVKPSPDDKADDTPATPTPVVTKVYFASPVQYEKTGMGFCDSKEVLFVFNKTLNTWQTHDGIDLAAEDGVSVCAMYDGTVVDVGASYGMGNYVKIDHGDNVVATYSSLADVKVVKGQAVNKGEQIGAVSTSASYELSDGAHLHLEIAVNGKKVDPAPYVKGEIFREVEEK